MRWSESSLGYHCQSSISWPLHTMLSIASQFLAMAPGDTEVGTPEGASCKGPGQTVRGQLVALGPGGEKPPVRAG